MGRSSLDQLRGFQGILAAIGLGCATGWAAEIQVKGAGWWTDRDLRRALSELSTGTPSDIITANAVEDAVFFVMSAVADDGYLRPEVEATIKRESGEVITHRFDIDFLDLLPRPLRGIEVQLVVTPGVRYRFGELKVVGGESAIKPERVRTLLIPRTGLLAGAADAVFTATKLSKGLEQVRLELDRAGFAGNVVEVTSEHKDPVTGQVDLELAIDPGARWRIAQVRVEGAAAVEIPRYSPDELIGQRWTASVEQDLVEQFRRAYYKEGYADVRFSAKQEFNETSNGERGVIMVIEITPGNVVTMGAPDFGGTTAVKREVLARRVELKKGERLNPIEVEEARRRLQRLRALRRVGVHYEPRDDNTRSPVFELEAREPWEANLLAGFGSYEQVRAGVEVKGNNLFRRSHQLRIEAIASVKSLSGDAVYTVPEVFGEAVDGNVRLFGLDREELSFQRQEYGGSVGLTRRSLPWINAEGLVNYTFQELKSEPHDLTAPTAVAESTSTASLTLGLRRDRRDNPLLPRKGQRWTVQIEMADKSLGGAAAFQRIELGWSWHRPLTEASWVHVGLSHGTILTLGQPDDSAIPVNKLFFPGGENSYRGLQSGEAVTRDTAGELIGAKSFSMLNLEYELALTQRISAVVFWDALGITARIADLPWEDTLHAAGVGVRYNTVIGPIRLEYGHNLNPRPTDPAGTLHLSIGYPF
jgi:outer membrane protein insertion porin family